MSLLPAGHGHPQHPPYQASCCGSARISPLVTSTYEVVGHPVGILLLWEGLSDDSENCHHEKHLVGHELRQEEGAGGGPALC